MELAKILGADFEFSTPRFSKEALLFNMQKDMVLLAN